MAKIGSQAILVAGFMVGLLVVFRRKSGTALTATVWSPNAPVKEGQLYRGA